MIDNRIPAGTSPLAVKNRLTRKLLRERTAGRCFYCGVPAVPEGGLASVPAPLPDKTGEFDEL